MRKQYTAPSLARYGAVEELTQLSGGGTKSDFFILNGNVVNNAFGGNTRGSLNFEAQLDGKWVPNDK